MKVRITGVVNHNNHDLELYEVYDLPDNEAQALVKAGVATTEGVEKKDPQPEPKPIKRAPKPKDEPYAAEATPKEPLKPNQVDDTPVVPPTTEPEVPAEVKVVDSSGKPQE